MIHISVMFFQTVTTRVKFLEDKCSAQASQIDSLVVENGAVKSENITIKADLDLVKQNYSSLTRRIAEIESSIAARAQEDAVRAQSDKDRDAVVISLKDRSNTLRGSIQTLQTQVDKGATAEMVYSSIAVVTRRLDDLELAAGRAVPGSGHAQSGGQSNAAIIARMREQIIYLGRWVHQLCEQIWDIQRFTRRRSLHVVSYSPFYSLFPSITILSLCSLSFRVESR